VPCLRSTSAWFRGRRKRQLSATSAKASSRPGVEQRAHRDSAWEIDGRHGQQASQRHLYPLLDLLLFGGADPKPPRLDGAEAFQRNMLRH